MSSLEFRLKHIDEKRNYLLEKINHNDLMSENCKKICTYLDYVENLLFLVLTVTGVTSISAFISLVFVPVAVESSAVGLKICEATVKIKNSMSIIKKKKKKD